MKQGRTPLTGLDRPGALTEIGRLSLIRRIVDALAHRLAQPLAAIANYAGAAIQMQQTRVLDAERTGELLELILRQAERGGEYLRDLRVLRGSSEQSLSVFQINPTIELASRLLEEHFHRLDIQVELKLQADLPSVLGFEAELLQVALHLMLNAIDSLSDCEQPRSLQVSTSLSSGSDSLRIEIGDNGSGIASDLRQQIFLPWFTTKPDALGLGLAAAGDILTRHEGRLELLTGTDKWTRFLIELPTNNSAYE